MLEVDRRTVRVPLSMVRRVEVHRGTHGSFRTVAFGVAGLLLGSVAGVAVGTLLQGECYELGCLAGPFYGLLVGAPFGVISGVWLALATRDRWVTSYRGVARAWVGSDRLATEPRLRLGVAIPLVR